MTALTTPLAPSSCSQALTAVATTVGRIGRWLVDAWRHRRDAVALATLDDHMLADIGLTRCGLGDALAEPLWRDPTAVLAHRYSEQRRVRCAVAEELIKPASPSLVPGADTFSVPPRDPPARLTL